MDTGSDLKPESNPTGDNEPTGCFEIKGQTLAS